MLKDLLEAMPVTGRRIRVFKGEECQWIFPVEQLHKGDVVRVLPGERIPSDGVIVDGCSRVTSQPIVRAAVIKELQIGDAVLCGTVNCSAVIDVRLTSDIGASSLVQKIKRLQQDCDLGLWERVLGIFRRAHRLGA